MGLKEEDTRDRRKCGVKGGGHPGQKKCGVKGGGHSGQKKVWG